MVRRVGAALAGFDLRGLIGYPLLPGVLMATALGQPATQDPGGTIPGRQ